MKVKQACFANSISCSFMIENVLCYIRRNAVNEVNRDG
jgi:hypothetical protein